MAETELQDKNENPSIKKTDVIQSVKLPHHYNILSEIGRGGMGAVYRAYDSKLQREVAIKLLTTDSNDEQSATRFRQEAKELSSFTHPNIVALLDYGKSESEDYIVLEYCKGGNLLDWIAKKPAVAEVVERFIYIAQGLDYIHNRGIVHRDLKPENILLTYEGQPRITDFGIARRLEENTRFTAAGTILGTSTYMAPEQIMSSEVGPAADIYSLGICLFEALTGSPPFVGNQHFALLQAHLTEVPPSVRSKQPDIPEELDRLVAQMLKKDPEERPGSAQEVIAVLKDIHLSSASEGQSTSSIERPKAYGELIDILKRIKSGEGVSVHLLGPSGSGRSHLLKKLCQYAKTEDVKTVVLSPQPEPIEALKQVWRDLGPTCPMQEILALEGVVGAASWIRNRLESCSQPTILICDDIEQHCSTNLSIINALSSLTPPNYSGWIISSTPAHKLSGASLQAVEIPPMSQQDLDQMFQAINGSAPTPSISSWLNSRSAGYPRQAKLLCHALTDLEGEPPGDLISLAKDSLDRLSENARLAMETICLASQPAPYDLILTGSGLAHRSLDGALAELSKGGYIEEDWTNSDHFQIGHDLYREILLKHLPTRTSRRIHLALASYYEKYSTTTQRGNHLLASGNRQEAFLVLIKEADYAKDYGFFPLAHNLLKAAISCSDHPGNELAEGQGLLAEVALESGNLEESKKILQETSPKSLSSQLQVDLVWIILANKESRPVDESKLVTPKGANPTTMREMQLSLSLHRQLAEAAFRQKDFTQASEHINQAIKLAHQINEPDAWGQALISSGYLKLGQGDTVKAEADARQAIEKTRTSDNPRWKVKAFELLGEVQMALGAPSRAALSFQQALEISRIALLDKRCLQLEQKFHRAQQGEKAAPPDETSLDLLEHFTKPEANKAKTPAPLDDKTRIGQPIAIANPNAAPDQAGSESYEKSSEPPPAFKAERLESSEAVPARANDLPQAKASKKTMLVGILALVATLALGGAIYYYSLWLNKPGQLVLNTHPGKVNLFIDGQAAQAIDSKEPISLTPGEHTLKIEAEGYTSSNRSILIKRDSKLSLDISLIATHGEVSFSKFPEGSTVTIDGSVDKHIIKPGQKVALPVGSHSIKISNGDLYKAWETTINVEPEKTIALNISMPRTRGDLTITSDPSGAQGVLEQGKQTSNFTTNTTLLNLKPGEYTINLKKDGYWSPAPYKVSVQAGDEPTKASFKLERREPDPEPVEPPTTQPTYIPPAYTPPVYTPPPSGGGGSNSGSGGGLDWQ